MSYKGIAPIFMQGREPYPDPNTLIFAVKSLSFVSFIVMPQCRPSNIVELLLNVKHANCVVLCVVI